MPKPNEINHLEKNIIEIGREIAALRAILCVESRDNLDI